MKPNRGVATISSVTLQGLDPLHPGLTPWRAVLLSVLLAACGTGAQVPVHEDDATFARSLTDTATKAAVAKTGARVCREMQVGIAERDWVRGVVVAADAAAIDVRVDEPGRYAHTLNGVQVSKGATLRDNPAAWILCVGNP